MMSEDTKTQGQAPVYKKTLGGVPESGFTFGGSDGKARVIAQINNKFTDE